MCHIREPTVLSRMSVPLRLLNFDRFHQPLPVTLAHPLTATETRLAVGQGHVRTVILAPRGDQSPLRAARSSLLCVSLEVLTTPTGRFHGRTFVRPSSPACATPTTRVFAHMQVRDPHESAAACWTPALGTPSSWPCPCPTIG